MKLKTIKMLLEKPEALEKAIKKKGIKRVKKAILKAYSREIRKILIPSKDLNCVLPLLKKSNPKMASEFERIRNSVHPDASEREELESLINASCIF